MNQLKYQERKGIDERKLPERNQLKQNKNINYDLSPLLITSLFQYIENYCTSFNCL